MGTARALCRRFQSRLPAGRPGVTILAYHLVGAGTGSPVDLPTEVFEGQVRALAGTGRVVPLRRAVQLLAGAGSLAEDRVVVTFDDAFENFDRVARPILEVHGIPATLFVPTRFLNGGPAPLAGAEGLPPVTWDRLGAFAAGGLVEVGSHSRTHADLRSLGRDELAEELSGSAEEIRDRTGVEPRTFCYPKGLWSPAVERAVSRVYRAAVVGGGRKNLPGQASPWRLQRVSIRSDMPATIEPFLGAALVLEEWLANRVRLARRPSRPAGPD